MRKQIIQNAAFDVATQVRAVEDSLDSTLAEVAELQGRLVRARAAMGVSVKTGQPAFEELANTLQALIAARSSIGNCHGALVDAQQFVPGLRTVAFGDADECPKTAVADLRVVA